ncbi:hypothetical protein EBAPG3_010580 [Nitrosospira lacus]|uniref:DUF4376 domain-containing protein n=1 Tax=Nitrosospira lacus TaxID=1288494 RepID=A0A1W6SQS2_9PROT|nr:hypothetical protein [Nitrosospira lacus]ARO88188.1 hypothetical protein EBAPG3_010580 [Nitrosospira lacus]
MKITYTRPDGGTSVITIAGQESVAKSLAGTMGPSISAMTESQFIDWVKGKDVPVDATNVQVVEDSDVPVDYTGRIASAHKRINVAYKTAIRQMTADYPADEVISWPKQEEEALAWLANNSEPTPWIDGAVLGRGITKAEFVDKIIANAVLFAPAHGKLTGKRQKLRDQIEALGAAPTQSQLDAIQW